MGGAGVECFQMKNLAVISCYNEGVSIGSVVLKTKKAAALFSNRKMEKWKGGCDERTIT